MIADPHRMPASHAPGGHGRRRHGAVQALDRLVLRELAQVAGRAPRPPLEAPDDEHDPAAAPAANDGNEPATMASTPALDASAARFVERALAWLARRDDAPAVLEALARAIAATAPAPAEQAPGVDDAPPA